ncbi:HET-domain-containing protein [Trichodelitschia bisporula]|uniref:HET-domain-containing protein n=1 Tax=Trichodelitschia bisporula TaxID=703511 RepID=A0A6G1HT89_9PEZI|nr:HET-domain-containing protein [Trichodelitschia bisporula]
MSDYQPPLSLAKALPDPSRGIFGQDGEACVTPNQLCDECRATLKGSKLLNLSASDFSRLLNPFASDSGLEATYEGLRHKCLREVALSANAGCHLCSIRYYTLLKELGSFELSNFPCMSGTPGTSCSQTRSSTERFCEQRDNSIYVTSPSSPSCFNMRFIVPSTHVSCGLDSAEDCEKSTLEMPNAQGRHLSSQKFINFKPGENVYSDDILPIWTGSRACLDKMKRWLHTCSSDHPECRNPLLKPNGRPTRLLDVGIRPGSARLCKTENMDPLPPYFTLSHCWGGAEFLSLTRQNLDEFLNKIPEDRLPATFADAFTVTRQLGYRYLWIDSLCIIQANKGQVPDADWITESAVMASVYSNAVLNIAAAWGRNPTMGLFVQRNPLPLYRCLYKNRLGEDRVIAACYSLSDDCNPLDTRGWVLQERLLASRSLSFGLDHVSWSCNRANENEFCAGLRFQQSKLKLRNLTGHVSEMANLKTPQHSQLLDEEFTVLNWLQ